MHVNSMLKSDNICTETEIVVYFKFFSRSSKLCLVSRFIEEKKYHNDNHILTIN